MAENNEACWGLTGVKNVLLVSSGKGGVGKSQMAVLTAMNLWKKGESVGLLDLDLCGPSIPRMLGLEGQMIRKSEEGYLPIYADFKMNNNDDKNIENSSRMKVVSMGFLLPRSTDGVAWKDPKKSSFVTAVLERVKWGKIDTLVIDLPPGVTGEKLTVAQHLRITDNGDKSIKPHTSVLIVTSPQIIALSDVRKEIEMWRRHGIKILGLVENMSGLTCPNCGVVDHVFSQGGARVLALSRDVNFVGCIPLDPAICQWADKSSTDDNPGMLFVEKSTEFMELIKSNNCLNEVLQSVTLQIVS